MSDVPQERPPAHPFMHVQSAPTMLQIARLPDDGNYMLNVFHVAGATVVMLDREGLAALRRMCDEQLAAGPQLIVPAPAIPPDLLDPRKNGDRP